MPKWLAGWLLFRRCFARERKELVDFFSPERRKRKQQEEEEEEEEEAGIVVL